jgi:hypothetical protein
VAAEVRALTVVHDDEVASPPQVDVAYACEQHPGGGVLVHDHRQQGSILLQPGWLSHGCGKRCGKPAGISAPRENLDPPFFNCTRTQLLHSLSVLNRMCG